MSSGWLPLPGIIGAGQDAIVQDEVASDWLGFQ